MQKIKKFRTGLLSFAVTIILCGLIVILGIILGLLLASLISRPVNNLFKPHTQYLNLVNSLLHITAGSQIILLLIAIFIITCIAAISKLTNKCAHNLALEEAERAELQSPRWLTILEAVLGLLLQVLAYFIVSLPKSEYDFFTIALMALLSIVTGTYLFCYSLLVFLYQRRKLFSKEKALITKSQLLVNLHHYTGALSRITLLFALTFGAIALSLDFSLLPEEIKKASYYDTIIVNKTPAVNKNVAKLTVKSKQTYHYKEDKKKLYFIRDELESRPIKYIKKEGRNYYLMSLKSSQLSSPNTGANDYFGDLIPNGHKKIIQIMPKRKWVEVKGKSKFVSLLRINNFDQDWPLLLKIEHIQSLQNHDFKFIYQTSKANSYQSILSMTREMQELAFAIAFVYAIILALTLWREIVNAARKAKKLYQKLLASGITKRILQGKINYVIILLLLPVILGSIDVLFGLRLFSSELPNVYFRSWLALLLTAVLYSAYYIWAIKWYKKLLFKSQELTGKK